jgi:Anti-sigma factor NepR
MLERGHESIQRGGLSIDIQRAIGQRLRQHYAIEQSLPARLANLLKQLEQRSNESKTVSRGHYVNAA